MHKLALWSREQMIASSSGFRLNDWSAAAGVLYRGLNPLKLFSELRIAEGSKESDHFDMVCKVSDRLVKVPTAWLTGH